MPGVETAIWGECINQDNFGAFVWRAATAAAERLWTTEVALGCPEALCPGITAAAAESGVSDHGMRAEPVPSAVTEHTPCSQCGRW